MHLQNSCDFRKAMSFSRFEKASTIETYIPAHIKSRFDKFNKYSKRSTDDVECYKYGIYDYHILNRTG